MGEQMKYADKLRDPRWQQKRLLIMNRDGWKCRDCGDGTQNLQVHHHHYARNPWEVDDYFLSTLCEDCHKQRQEFENAAKIALAIMMRRSSASQIEALASKLSSDARLPHAPDWLLESRWISYATEYPVHRPFVEMVLGREIAWEEPGRASA
jgi:hypothetical protein